MSETVGVADAKYLAPRRLRRVPLWTIVAMGSVAGIVAYFLSPSDVAQGVIFTAASLWAAFWITVGIRIHRPQDRLTSILLAAYMTFTTAGSAVWYVVVLFHSPGESLVAGSNIFYGAGYLCLITAMLRIAIKHIGKRIVAALIDALIVVINTALIAWVLIIDPLSQRAKPIWALAVELSYPVLDVVVLTVLLSVLFTCVIRRPAFLLLVVSIIGMLASDAAWYWQATSNSYVIGGWIDIGWLVAFAALAVAGVHPSLKSLGTRNRERSHPRSLPFVWLVLAVVVPPIVLLFDGFGIGPRDSKTLVWACLSIVVLVLLRMSGLFRDINRALQEKDAQRLSLIRALEARAEAERELRANEELFRQLTDNLDSVVWLKDARTRQLLYLSPGFEQLWGRPVQQVYADPRAWRGIHEDDVEAAKAALEEVTEPVEVRYRVVRPDGSIRSVRDRAYPIADSDGNITRVAGISEDVTDRDRLEAQVLHSQKMEGLGNLAGGVAHDFNNLLSVILNYTTFARDEMEDDHPIASDLDEVVAAAQKGSALTRQLLTFSRRDVTEPQPITVSSELRDSLKLINRLVGEHVTVHLSDKSSKDAISIDPVHLQQVVMNLAVNARDAMPLGGMLEITCRTVEVGNVRAQQLGVSPGAYQLLKFADSGCGMADDVREHMFDPFFTTKDRDRGTGLGLATVYGIVTNAGGAIDVASAVNRGTTFELYFPVTRQRDATEEPSSKTRSREPISGTILLVEDDDQVRSLTERMLRRGGHDVTAVPDVAKALEIYRSKDRSFDLVLTDVILRGATGRDLADALSVEADASPVLFMSGYTDQMIAGTGVLEQGAHFIQKPFGSQQLLDAVGLSIASGRSPG